MKRNYAPGTRRWTPCWNGRPQPRDKNTIAITGPPRQLAKGDKSRPVSRSDRRAQAPPATGRYDVNPRTGVWIRKKPQATQQSAA